MTAPRSLDLGAGLTGGRHPGCGHLLQVDLCGRSLPCAECSPLPWLTVLGTPSLPVTPESSLPLVRYPKNRFVSPDHGEVMLWKIPLDNETSAQ